MKILRRWLCLCLLVLGLMHCIAETAYCADKPNVVVLFADDGGYADFGFQPNVKQDMADLTPHIDTIATEGVVFSQAYVSACVCSPSRAGLMTGRYQQRFGHDSNLPAPELAPLGLPLSETFCVERLQENGYHTGLIGKWHLGYPDKYHPYRRGFNYFYGLLQGSRSYFPYENPSPFRVIRENEIPEPEEGYVTDRIGDAACNYIDEHKDKPFFLFVSFTSPHGPLEPRKGYNDEDRLRHIKNAVRKKYAGLIVAMDDNVGKILETLKSHELTDNTLVIFTNDNGGPGPNKTGADNYPLKGFKGGLDEGGIRVPFAARMPGLISRGSLIDQPITTLDIFPTIYELAGIEIDSAWNLDGLSLLPLLEDATTELPDRTFYWRRNGPGNFIAIRDQDWKLIYTRKQSNPVPRLYNLANDVGEQNDVSSQYPETVAMLQKKLVQWESQLSDPLWRSNKGKKSNKPKGTLQ